MYFNKYLKRMSYTLLLVIRRVLNFISQRFGTFCLFHLHMRVDILHTYTPMKMEQTEYSKTSAHNLQTPGNYSQENVQHSEKDESLKSRI